MNASVTGTTVFAFHRAVMCLAGITSNMRDFRRYCQLSGNVSFPEVNEMFALHGKRRKRYILIDVLYNKCELLVSRRHDRFYAVMHLAQDYQDGDISVDYNRGLNQVMLDVANHHIRKHQDLAFLLQSHRTFGYEPSWIPDCWLGNTPGVVPSAGGGIQILSQCSLRTMNMNSTRLTVRGIKIDKLLQIFSSQHSATNLTAALFWASPLGRYLQPYMCNNAAGLPAEVFRTISDNTNFSKYCQEGFEICFAYLHTLSQDAKLAEYILVDDEAAALPGWSQNAHRLMQYFLTMFWTRRFGLTDRGFFSLMPACNVSVYDEIWMVLGCPQPIVLRRRDDGAYSHVCVASIPGFTDSLKEHEDFTKFTMETQLDEKIGEWTIEDIEIA